MHVFHITQGTCAFLKVWEIWKISNFLNVIKFNAIYFNTAEIDSRLNLHLDCDENWLYT